MKKNRNLILIVVIILLLAAGIYFLFKDDNKGMNTASSSAPSIEFHNSDVKETKDGKIVWRFKAGHATVSKDQNFIDMEQVEGDFMKDGDGSAGYFCRRFWKRYGRRYYGRCADL